MSITDPVVLVCGPEYELPWSLIRGRETFFDENDVQRRWSTSSEALEWAEANLGVSPLDHLPEIAQKAGREFMRRERMEDLPLFSFSHKEKRNHEDGAPDKSHRYPPDIQCEGGPGDRQEPREG